MFQTGKEKAYPLLIHGTDYSLTQSLGAYLYGQGSKGLIFRSARDSNGINVGIFHPDALSNVRHNCYLRYIWERGSDVRVEKQTGKLLAKISSSFL